MRDNISADNTQLQNANWARDNHRPVEYAAVDESLFTENYFREQNSF